MFSWKTLAILSCAWVLNACQNDMKTVNTITRKDHSPAVVAKDIELVYSDSAKVGAILKSPLVENYPGDDPYIVFPKGFVVTFYDDSMHVKSSLSANYGVSRETRKIMEAKGNVVVYNFEKNQKLNTEHLIWYQVRKMIISDEFVKITTATQVLYGDGLTSDESLSKIHIGKVKGKMALRKDM